MNVDKGNWAKVELIENFKTYSKLEMIIIEPTSQKQDEQAMTSDRMSLLNYYLPPLFMIWKGAWGLVPYQRGGLWQQWMEAGREGGKRRTHFSPLCASPTGSPAAQVLSVLAPCFVQPHTDADCCLCANSVGGLLLPERSLTSWLWVRKNKIRESLLKSEERA